MADSIHIVVDDQDIGRCQRAILKRCLSRSGARLHLLSDERIAPPGHWQVKPEPGLRMASMLQVLAGDAARGRVLWLSGAVMLTAAPDGSPFDGPPAALRGRPGQRLGLQLVLAFDPAAPEASAVTARARTLLEADFHDAADATLDMAPLPPAWTPSADLPAGSFGLFDGRPIATRPWYASRAPQAAFWVRQLREALADRALSRTDIEADVEGGFVRASILFELDSEPGAMPVPGSVAAMDTVLPVHELAPTQSQLELLRTWLFAPPQPPGGIRRDKPRKVHRPKPRSREKAKRLPPPLGWAPFRARQIRTYGELAAWTVDTARKAMADPRHAIRRVREIVVHRL